MFSLNFPAPLVSGCDVYPEGGSGRVTPLLEAGQVCMESFCFPANTRVTEVLGTLGDSWARTLPGLQGYFSSFLVEHSVITERTSVPSVITIR